VEPTFRPLASLVDGPWSNSGVTAVLGTNFQLMPAGAIIACMWASAGCAYRRGGFYGQTASGSRNAARAMSFEALEYSHRCLRLVPCGTCLGLSAEAKKQPLQLAKRIIGFEQDMDELEIHALRIVKEQMHLTNDGTELRNKSHYDYGASSLTISACYFISRTYLNSINGLEPHSSVRDADSGEGRRPSTWLSD
jgi:hypothetical protein